MYQNVEIMIHLSPVEVQQAWGIWLDDNAAQALWFLKEKVLDQTEQSACQRSRVGKLPACRFGRRNCACCRQLGVGAKSSPPRRAAAEPA